MMIFYFAKYVHLKLGIASIELSKIEMNTKYIQIVFKKYELLEEKIWHLHKR